MGCIVEFANSLMQFEFNCQGSKQKILVDMLLKYSEQDITTLASALDISVNELQDIYDSKHVLDAERANDLAQLFLIFFGRLFFTKFTLIRNFY